MKRSDAIKTLLLERSVPDLAAMYKPGLEVQVNVGQHGGNRITRDVNGSQWQVWVNNDQTEEWANYRIPRNASSGDVYDNDRTATFDHMKYVDAIGLTGWNYQTKRSEFFGFDFDSISNHNKGLSELELQQVREAAFAIPWITIRRSTSGSGYHLYIHLDEPFPTDNHTEHAAVARAMLSKMMSVTGYLFDSKVDVCGHILWWWHRKMAGTNGLELVKQGEPFPSRNIPGNWRDHIEVVSGKRKRVKAKRADGTDINDLLRQKTLVGLDKDHLRIIAELEGSASYWDADNHVLVTHTHMLKQIHSNLDFKGYFETLSTGADCPNDINCFCYPMIGGGFSVYRFGKGAKEHSSWRQDGQGWTYTYFNRDPDLLTIMDAYSAIKTEKKDYLFRDAFAAMDALSNFGLDLKLKPYMHRREVRVREEKDGTLIVKVESSSKDDNINDMHDWELTKDGCFTKIFKCTKKSDPETIHATYDDDIRHIVSVSGEDMGWMVKASSGRWHRENLQNVRLFLKHNGLRQNEIDYALGWAVNNPWRMVAIPFEEEYPGGRDWNRGAPQFAFELEAPDVELKFPTWNLIFDHLGRSLDDAIARDPWCSHNQIYTGSMYLKLWVASMFQQPDQPTPYLFFYGEQNTGKSIFHEALSLLMTAGVVRADQAMQNSGGFNGELLNAVLCNVEETHLGKDKKAYARLKDWVTSIHISIHVKNETPFMVRNTTHWCQFANEQDACPVFTGDKRITYIYVQPLEKEIPKKVLLNKLREEGAHFLTQMVMRTDIPEATGRLNIPPIRTTDMEEVQLANENVLERYLRECCRYVPGNVVLMSDFFAAFREWVRTSDPEEFIRWSTPNKVTRELPIAFSKIFGKRFCKGRSTLHASAHAYGNLAIDDLAQPQNFVYVSDGQTLRRQECDSIST